jgi:hypothetical protein
MSLDEIRGTERYQIKILHRFAAFESLHDDLDVSRAKFRPNWV